MMARPAVLAALLALAACGEQAADTEFPASDIRASEDFETIAATLAADRDRLEDARAACREKRPEASALLCNAAAEATRRRFRSRGTDPYADDPVIPANATPGEER